MANPKITVEIGAVADGLIKNVDGSIRSLEQLQRELDDLDKKLRTAADPTEIIQLNQQIGALKTGMQQLRTVGLQPLTKATSQYNSVGVDFARIIQDAPFGIIGVSNNITQLADSFQAARGKGQSFTKILGSIFSSGNALTLGISVLTSAFVVLQQKGFFKTEQTAESLGDALDEYRKKLDAVTQASIEGQANSKREIQSFNLLRAQAENANISQSTRLEAVRQLKKEYPEYLTGLSDEQILTGKVGVAYDKLTKSIIATGKARAFSDKIAKNSLDLLTLEEQAQNNVTTLLEKQAKLAPLLAAQANQAAKSRGEFTGLDLQILDLQKEIRDLQFDQVSNIENSNKLKSENLTLESKITEQISNGAKFTQTQVSQLKEIKRTNEEIQNIQTNRPPVSFNPSVPNAPGINPENIQSQTNALNALQLSLNNAGVSFEQFQKALANGASQGFDSVEEFINRLGDVNTLLINSAQLLQESLNSTLGNLGDALGTALATGQNVVQALGNSLLMSMADFLGKLGQQLIAYGTAGSAFGSLTEAIQKGGPASIPAGILAVGAGIALIAAASAIKSTASKGMGGGRGGSFSGGSGVSQGTSFAGAGVGMQFDRSLQLAGEFRVKGQDLVYVFNEASSKNQRG
jgi:hypothetical protein